MQFIAAPIKKIFQTLTLVTENLNYIFKKKVIENIIFNIGY